ncbi:peptide ABC transporter substrate-binding protein [Clostridium tunisiense]|uniref:peptide ABC transporter substrate-binding protein n=1 Tax=Clostridium tunisiense TaxID=219748 RepID=UPI0003114415|nr:peptide ABC transporter substrate-binding protein [Clostridium tunisiense]
MKKLFYIIFLIGILICSVSIENENRAINTTDYISYNLGQRPNNLVMTDNLDVRKKDILLALFQGLVTEDANGEIINGIAEEYTVSEDGLEYTFKIRESAKYSNGDKIVAQDFTNFFKSFIEDKNNIYAEQLNCIFGVQDFKNRKVGFEEVAIKAKDERLLSIRLNYRCPYFIKILSQPVYSLRDYNVLMNGFDESYKKIRYTGPFIVDKINEKKHIIIAKNLNYYGSNEVTNEVIKFTFVEDKEKALANFELNGEGEENIHIVADTPVNEYFRLENEGKLKSFPSNSVYYLNFNIKGNKLAGDINFRNALNSILSKEYYSQQIAKNFAIPASLYVPKGNADKKLFDTFANKNQSEEYLKKTNIKGNETITLVYEEDGLNKRIAEDLAKNILQDLGIHISIKGYRQDELEQVIQKNQYDMHLSKFKPIFDDMYLYYDIWSSKSKENLIRYSNPKYDEIVKAAKYEWNEEQRSVFYRQCEDILREDLPSVPIYYINTILCIKPNITGVYATPSGNIKLEYLKVN